MIPGRHGLRSFVGQKHAAHENENRRSCKEETKRADSPSQLALNLGVAADDMIFAEDADQQNLFEHKANEVGTSRDHRH